MSVRIDVIIPTTGSRTREIERAIASVQAQIGVSARAIIVVNGDRYDPGFVASLRDRPNHHVCLITQAGVSNARLVGRRLVDASYFAFLDDDDELLPEAMNIRLGGFSSPDTDMVATNGYLQSASGRTILFERFDQHPEDAALALLKDPWLASAGALYRTQTVTPDELSDLPDYFEVTKLAFRLALTRTCKRIDIPTFIIHQETAARASQTRRFREEERHVLASMAAMTTRPDLRILLRKRRSAALHARSSEALNEGQIADAWRYHLQSVALGGWQYLTYSRHLITRSARA